MVVLCYVLHVRQADLHDLYRRCGVAVGGVGVRGDEVGGVGVG